MLEGGVYTTLPSNWLKVEEISNIQCYISTRKPRALLKDNLQGIFPTFMLAYF